MLEASRPRCLAVAIGLTAAVWGAAAVLAGWLADSIAASTRTAGAAIDQLCLVALLVTLAWGWLQAMAGVVEAWRGTPRRAHRGVLRRVVLTACGVALTGVLAAPAHAEAPGQPGSGADLLSGLPFPERPVGAAHAPLGRTVVVHTGDTLWSLAAAGLPANAGAEAVAARWPHIHRVNRGVIGPDPDLILPGQVLHVPNPSSNPSSKEPS
jgi:nucleoid-associated protein YgaU